MIGLSSKISMPSLVQELVHFVSLSQKSCQGRDGLEISWKACPAKLDSVLKPLFDIDRRSFFCWVDAWKVLGYPFEKLTAGMNGLYGT